MARQMKDSGVEWIGQIPEDWEIVRIKQLFAEVDERCTKGNEYTLLSVSEYYGVSPKKDHLNEDDMLTHAETLDGYKICRKNDIVMNIMLAWKRALGVSEYVGIISPAYCVYRARQEVCAKYFHYLFRTDIYAELFKQNSTGIIDSRLRLYPDKFLALKCQVPPLEQQDKIASYLDRKCAEIDAIIAKQQQIIEKLKEYKLSVITEAVTKGLDPNVPMKDSGVEWIGKIPKHWNVAKMKFVASFFNGDRSSKYPSGTDIVDTGVIFVTSNNLGNIILNKNVDTKYITKEKYDDLGGAKLRINDIIFCLRGSVGKCSINKTESEGTIASSLVVIRAKKIPADYLIFVLQCPGITAMSILNAIGIGSLNLSAEDISEIFIPVPSQDDAKQIAKFLERKIKTIDKMINKKTDYISKLIDYKKSLIYEVVTGKKEV